jgi:hypothetical protein
MNLSKEERKGRSNKRVFFEMDSLQEIPWSMTKFPWCFFDFVTDHTASMTNSQISS